MQRDKNTPKALMKQCLKLSKPLQILIYINFICIAVDEVGRKTPSALSSFDTSWQHLNTKLQLEHTLVSPLPPCLEEINCLSGMVERLQSNLIILNYCTI